MSVTNDVARIMGYTLEWPDGHSTFQTWWKDGANTGTAGRPYDEETILDWLCGKPTMAHLDYLFDVTIERRHLSETVVTVADGHGSNDLGVFTASTLIKALELAVIATEGWN